MACLLATALLLAACRASPPAARNQVVYGIATQPVRLNPIAQPDIVSRWAVELVFDGLVDVGDRPASIAASSLGWIPPTAGTYPRRIRRTRSRGP